MVVAKKKNKKRGQKTEVNCQATFSVFFFVFSRLRSRSVWCRRFEGSDAVRHPFCGCTASLPIISTASACMAQRLSRTGVRWTPRNRSCLFLPRRVPDEFHVIRQRWRFLLFFLSFPFLSLSPIFSLSPFFFVFFVFVFFLSLLYPAPGNICFRTELSN